MAAFNQNINLTFMSTNIEQHTLVLLNMTEILKLVLLSCVLVCLFVCLFVLRLAKPTVGRLEYLLYLIDGNALDRVWQAVCFLDMRPIT